MGDGGNDTLKCLTLVIGRNVVLDMFADIRFGKQLCRKEKKKKRNNKQQNTHRPSSKLHSNYRTRMSTYIICHP